MEYWNLKKEFVSDDRQKGLNDKLHDLLEVEPEDLLEHEHRFVGSLDSWQGNFTVYQGLALEKLWRKMNYKKYED
jgi:hypothetical protein